MVLIDTHTHLFSEEFNSDRSTVVEKAIRSGVEKMLLPNIDIASIEPMLTLEAQFPSNCHAMMGLHPGSVGKDYKSDLAVVRTWLDKRKFIAVGEIGMDYYWDKTFMNEQKECFRIQLEWAKEFKIPVAIHQRECFDDLFEIIKEVNDDHLTGVFHCFTGSSEEADKILSLGGFKLGIGGVLTYKKSNLPEVLKHVSVEDLVLETDSPYLTPAPHRGKRNESAYVLFVAEKLALVYDRSPEQIAEVTTKNARALFGI